LNGLIIEGVTGAGKTSIIAELQTLVPFERFDEDATFDDFMEDLKRDRELARDRANRRMGRILDAVASAEAPRNVLLERFHFSHVALDDDWASYDEIDRRCSAMGFKAVLLTIPEGQIATRSLYRAEYDGRDWQGFVNRYGSEAPALQALESSQRRRIGALRQSRLEHVLIETSARDWRAYARQIAKWAGWAP
jgi:thymidylate kinase